MNEIVSNELFTRKKMISIETRKRLFFELLKTPKILTIYYKFLILILRNFVKKQEKVKVYELFEVFDVRNKGFFDFEEFKEGWELFRHDLNENEIRENFEKIDADENGIIRVTQFVAFLSRDMKWFDLDDAEHMLVFVNVDFKKKITLMDIFEYFDCGKLKQEYEIVSKIVKNVNLVTADDVLEIIKNHI